MKKLFMVLCVCVMLAGCGKENTESSSVAEITETVMEQTETQVATEIETQEATEVAVSLMDENIQKFDLSLPENKVYCKYEKSFDYGRKFEMSGWGTIIEDISLYLETDDGEKITLVEIPEENTEMYASIGGVIDENRFFYQITNLDCVVQSGIYNLATGEDYHIQTDSNGIAYIPKKAVGNELYLIKGRIADLRGYAKLNLDTYEITEVDCSFIGKEGYWWLDVCFSSDGEKVASYVSDGENSEYPDMNKYSVAVFSMKEEKLLHTYNFYTENEYVNHQIMFYSDSQIYLFTHQHGDNPKDFLYIINLDETEDVPYIDKNDDQLEFHCGYDKPDTKVELTEEQISEFCDYLNSCDWKYADETAVQTPEDVFSIHTSDGVLRIYSSDNLVKWSNETDMAETGKLYILSDDLKKYKAELLK